ncbi:LysE family translocator [Brevundimonas sp.]|uniref:LysE family translocator n=1 Tax=Brevundimonas sp. TaxID=1871086 RepID=UPI003BABA735
MLSSLPVDPHLYVAFLGVMAVLAVTPGPANLFAVATGMERGRGQALLGVVGMNLATLVWFVAAALGLGALVLAFPQVFRIVAWVGAAYVAWLGIKSLIAAFRPRGTAPDIAAAPVVHRRRSALIDGFMVQFANPKVVLFFSAVLPPFLDAARPMAPQMALFALAGIGMDALSMSAYGLGGAAMARAMSRPGFQRGFSLVVGGLLLLASVLIVSRL